MMKLQLNSCLLLFFFALITTQNVQATHIVGGEMRYKCLSQNQYEISLTLRRDCLLGQAPFDDPATVGIYQKINGAYRLFNNGNGGVVDIPYAGNDTINQRLESTCGIIGGEVCVEETTYKSVIELTPGFDYILVHQRCCRNNSINNIIDPQLAGVTIYIEITADAIALCNSSPIFKDWPPIYLCGGVAFSMDHSSFDAEGDSIVYSLCTPFTGATQQAPRPAVPNPPPFAQVSFRPPFSLSDVMGGSSPLQIDPVSGLLSVTPSSTIEQHVAAICMSEYRNGKLLTMTQREFQLNVRICVPEPEADFDAPQTLCDGEREVSFRNTSINANTFRWYFNYPQTNLTSTNKDPVFQFPASGKYRVALIATGDLDCKDTIIKDLFIYDPDDLIADFDFVITHCQDSVSVKLSDKSIDKFGNIISFSWTISLNNKLYSSNQRNPFFHFREEGNANVILQIQSSSGCNQVVAKLIPIQRVRLNVPTAPIKICVGDTIQLLQNFDPNLRYVWSPNYNIDCLPCGNARVFPDTSIQYNVIAGNGLCEISKTVQVIVEKCNRLECVMRVQQKCLPSGMVEITALDRDNTPIDPKNRQRELFWNIKDGPGAKYYSVTQKNPVVVSNYSRYCVTYKKYQWKPEVPKTIEYADICQSTVCDTIQQECKGPCEDFAFLLSSCDDDYDVLNNLDYPPDFCKSVCYNKCDYIVGIFDLQGKVIDANAYQIKWSTGETGPWNFQKGCFKNYLTVEVRKGDCVWFGRYRESCELYTGKRFGMQFGGVGQFHSLVERAKQTSSPVYVYNLIGQQLGELETIYPLLPAGVYTLRATDGSYDGAFIKP